MTWRVYVLKEPIERDPEQPVRYVGYTKKKLTERLYYHIKDANRIKTDGSWFQNDHRAHWLRLLTKNGLKPQIEELESGEDEDGWRERERYWIAFYRSTTKDLVNHLAGGEGPSGHNPTIETRQKLSAAMQILWQRPDQRQKRLKGLRSAETHIKRVAGIQKAYKDPNVIARGSAHLLDPITKANKLIGIQAGKEAGHYKRIPTYSPEQMEAASKAYFEDRGCIKCLAVAFSVPESALLKHLRLTPFRLSSRKGHPCKWPGTKAHR